MAPDGVRIAFIAQHPGEPPALYLAAIGGGPANRRRAGRARRRTWPSDQAAVSAPNITDPASLTWYDADNLLVLNASGRGNTLWEVPVDGQQATGPQLTPQGAVSIAADGAANALVVGLADNSMAVSTGLSVQWQTLSQLGQDPAYPVITRASSSRGRKSV